MSKEIEARKLKKIYTAIEFARGLSHPKLAKLMKTDKSQISHMMNGRNPINLERGLQFCRHFGCELEDFSPRLAREANNLVGMIEGKVGGVTGDVGFLAGSSMSEIINTLLNRKECKNQIYWPGPHSFATYGVPVEGEANAPELPHGSTAIVDTHYAIEAETDTPAGEQKKEVEVGKIICLADKSRVKFARYLGDDFGELINESYPDRVFKITKRMSFVGVVIGSQIYK